MNNRLLFALCFFLFQLSLTHVLAVKAYPYPITVTQPDGSQLTIRLQGDEFRDYKTTEDGYLLKVNANGILTYATINTLGETVASNLIAHDIDKRTPEDIEFLKTAPTSEFSVVTQQSARQRVKMQRISTVAQRPFPRMGNVKTLVILVSFPDLNYITPNPQVAFNSMFNTVGYNTNKGTGSARDYFMASSYGKFTPNFDVVGPYMLPNNQTYYGKDSLLKKDINIEQMVIDACTQASANGIDFSQYDANNDGYVDNVSIVYAGQSQAEGASSNAIWPLTSNITNPAISFNGKLISGFTCVSELKYGVGTTMTSVGVFCHEFGHVLGLPDYYNTLNANYTLDKWDIMDAGSYLNLGCTPPTYSTYDRFYLGYFTPQEINSTSNVTLSPIYQGSTTPANTNNQAFLFSATTHNLNGKSPNPKEFFMIEYRKKTGWDSYLPLEGMLIWHIDYDQTAWDMNSVNSYTDPLQTPSSHMRVYLQPSSGSIIAQGTAFKSGNYTPLSWLGADINRSIAGITTTADSITFKFMPTRILTTGNYSRFFTELGTPSAVQSINLTAYSLTGDVQISLANSVHFEMKLPSENSWSKSLSITPANGFINTAVQLRYNPYLNGNQTDKLTISGAGVPDINFNISGISTVPVNPPTIYIGKVENSLRFDETVVNTTNAKTLNIKTTYVNSDLSVALTGSDAAFFSTSAQANIIPKDIANSVDGFNVTVNYKPAKHGHHTATLTISGGGLPNRVIALSGNGTKNNCDR
jgi:immune inhibitor A